MSRDALNPVCAAWINKIQLAFEVKKHRFQTDADEAMAFFSGPYDFLYGPKNVPSARGFSYAGDELGIPSPSFQMTLNKTAELVQLFGPALYHRNPVRQVNPRHPPMVPPEVLGNANDPQVLQIYEQLIMQAEQALKIDKSRSELLQHYLNYTPVALDLKTHSRFAIDEAIIKGMGVLWTEVYQPKGGAHKMVGSFYDTVDNLIIDADVEMIRDARWIARRCIKPYWEVEREYNLPEDSLKGIATMESYSRQGELGALGDGDYNRKRGLTNDLMVYWKVYSKMGMGGRLAGIDPQWRRLNAYGDNVYLCVAKGLSYPLNLPPEIFETADDAAIGKQLEWPTPFWADDKWPFTQISFHDIPREIWPMSHMKPGMGELKFLNWAFSFLAGKVRIACRDFVAILKSASEDLKNSIITGPDYTVIQVEAIHQDIDKVVKFLQHPTFNPEIYKVIEGVTRNFEQRTGLTELAYGLSAKQMRSAEEASVKGDQISVRPDDMANKVEDSMTELARKEALAARWHLTGADVMPVMGQVGSMFWDRLLTPSDPAEILYQLEYRIEAGSARKPNKARDQSNWQQVLQSPFPAMFMQYAQATGDMRPINSIITNWAKSLDIDPTGLTLGAAPPAPPAAGGPGGGPSPGGSPAAGGPPPGPPPGR